MYYNPDNTIEVISNRLVSLLELFLGRRRPPKIKSTAYQYISVHPPLLSVQGKEWPYINLTISFYGNYVAELRLELVFPDLQSDALPTALSRSACVMCDCKGCVVI